MLRSGAKKATRHGSIAMRGFRSTPKAQAKPSGPYEKITIGVPKETLNLERRVAQTPGKSQIHSTSGLF